MSQGYTQYLPIPLPATLGGTGLTTTTANQLLWSPTNNTIGGLSTVATAILLTNGSGVPAWSAAPLSIAYGGTGVVACDPVIQRVNVQTGTLATGSTVIPFDNTIPQNTEGDQYMTLAITPKNASNKLQIQITLWGAHSIAGAILSVALFQDTTANALAAVTGTVTPTSSPVTITFTHTMSAGTTSSTTFKVRAGGNVAGTTSFNGSGGGQIFGGVAASSIIITEYST